MIGFIYGLDSYRIRGHIQNILESYSQKHAGNISIIKLNADTDESTPKIISELEHSTKNIGLFSNKKIIVLGHALTKHLGKEVEDFIKTYKLEKDPDIFLLLYEYIDEQALNKKAKQLVDFLKKTAKPYKEIALLTPLKLIDWISIECKKLGVTIELSATTLLANKVSTKESTPGDIPMWHLAQEIKKLVSYAQNRTITETDVAALITSNQETKIFAITDALTDKNKSKTFSLLYQALQEGMEPAYVFSMITHQLRNLLLIKSLSEQSFSTDQIAKKTSIHPYVISKIAPKTKKFALEELKKHFLSAAKIEREFKNGEIDLTDELFNLIFVL